MTTPVTGGTNRAVFDPKVLAPFPRGLYEHVDWVQDGGPERFLREDGVVIRPVNFPAAGEHGAVTHDFCDPAPSPLVGSRPDLAGLNAFVHSTVWYADRTVCGDIRAESMQETRDRVLQNFMRLEQIDAERAFADALVTAAGAPVAASGLKDGIGIITDAAAKLGVGEVFIHARPYWAVQEYGLFTSDLETVLGAKLVVGGGYVDELGDLLIATTPVYGWRGDPFVQESLEHRENQLYSLAERSVLLGYEKIIAAVEVS